MGACAQLLHLVLTGTRLVSDTTYRIDPALVTTVREEVRWLCARNPLPIDTGAGAPVSLIGVGP
ncbi:hypothetical protein STENM36S_08042 [Streptomyces tendae]